VGAAAEESSKIDAANKEAKTNPGSNLPQLGDFTIFSSLSTYARKKPG
jgi:hypothetical protein